MFHNCKNIQDVKKLFRKAAKFLHPDYGGENELMILLKESYQMACEFHEKIDKEEKNSENEDHEKNRVYEKSFEDVNEGDERLKIISEIQEYADRNSHFETKFVDSVSEYLEKNGFITSGQFNALVNIYYNFRMDKKEEATCK